MANLAAWTRVCGLRVGVAEGAEGAEGVEAVDADAVEDACVAMSTSDNKI